MTKFSKMFFFASNEVSTCSGCCCGILQLCDVCKGGWGRLNGRRCRGASCSQIQTYAIFVQFFVVFMCYTLVYYIGVYCVLVYIIIEHCVFVYFSFLLFLCVFRYLRKIALLKIFNFTTSKEPNSHSF